MKIEGKVIGILKEISGVKNIILESDLQTDLMLDSLSLVMLLLDIEEEFKIELKESDMNPFDLKTVQNVINLVKKYVKCDE